MSEVMEPGIGKLLASAREFKGLTTADVADKLKLTSRQIEALEAEEFDKLPAAVFVRGFIRNYARLVGLDAERLMANLGGEMQGATQNITVPTEGVTISSSPWRRWMIYVVGALALFLLLVALLYQWLSQGEQALVVEPPIPMDALDRVPASTAQEPALPDLTKPQASLPTAPAETPALVSPPIVAPAPAVTAPAAVAPPAALPAAPAKPAPAALPAPVTINPYLAPVQPSAPRSEAAPTTAKPDPGAARLRLVAIDESWVQVTDNAGKRNSKLIERGADAYFTGSPPFQVVIGNAASVRLHYNDQTIDLRPFTSDKVARLTLE
jgi:cytoskeleton protein RodZ